MGTGKKPGKVAILIAGTHRSGTSPLARVASLLGYALPKTLLEANPANEKGYWESVLVNRLNDEVLALAKVNWRAWQPLPEDWSRQPGLGNLKEKALATLESEFGSARFFVLKDPRICRLIDFWRNVLESFDARPVAVCPIRNPLEVAASLEKRNGLVPALSHLIWLRYVLDAERGTRAMPRTFTSYDGLLNAWRPFVNRMSANLGISWPRSPEQAAFDIDAFLSKTQRHHALSDKSVTGNLELPEWLRTTYGILVHWARKHERRHDFKALDRIRRELGNIPQALLPFVGHEEMEEARRLRKRIDRNATELARGDAEVKSNEQQLHGVRARLEETTGRLALRDTEASANAAVLTEVKARLVEMAHQLASHHALADAYAAQLAEVKAQLAESARELARHDVGAEFHTAQLAEVKAQLAESARELARRDVDAELRAAQLAEVKAQLAESARELARRDVDAELRAAQLAETKAKLTDVARHLAEHVAQAEANAQQLQDLRSRLVVATRELAQRDAEASAKSEELNELKSQVAQTVDQLSQREKEMQVKSVQISEAATESERRYRKLKTVQASHAKLQTDLDRAQASLSRLQRERDEARQEVKRLDTDLRGIHSSRVWRVAHRLASIVQMVEGALKRLQIRPSRPEGKMVHLVASSDFFDRDWYLTQNPDVAARGIDPALHYVLHGAAEGRDPGPGFSTQWYLDRHEDVAAAGMNPLLHYLLHGMAEGRAVKPSSTAHAVRPAPSVPPVPTEPPVAAVEPFSLPEPQAAGMSWVTQKDFVRRRGHVSLELSGLILGLAPIPQADADETWMAIADSARALVAFCRLFGMKPGEEIGCQIGDMPFDVAAKLDAVDPTACPVISFESGAKQAAIADIWYVNDRDLRVRFNTGLESGVQPCVARFYQYDHSSGGKLLPVGESVVHGREVDFANLALTNAFLPILITLATPEGGLLSASLLPFPSLCRGGVHYGELCAVGREPSYLENLQTVSSSLLGEMLGESATAPEFSIARIEIDLQGAIGSERIFSTEIREWLACIMRVTVGSTNSVAITSPKVRAHLEQSIAPIPLAHKENLAEKIAARERGGTVTVTLPPDSVPSLHGLVSRGFHIRDGRAVAVGAFVIADSSTLTPQWTVRLPPLGEELLALQPANAGIGFPVLTRLSPEENHVDVADFNGVPYAVRLCDTRDRHPASLIMPVAPDAPGPLLRHVASSVVGQHATISVIVPPSHQRNDAFAALLESLKLQTMGESVEIIAIVDPTQADRNHAAENALRRFFPARYQLVTQDSDPSPNARINRAAEHATGTYLLIARANIVLHDPRTLETLQTIADHDKVASAGCVLLQTNVTKQLQTVVFRSGGIFPSAPLHRGMHDAVLSELDCFDIFRFATYPVVGNSSALFMVRSDVWRTLGGFDATNFPDVHADIEYGVRAIARGYVHLCTSVVSAELNDRDFRASYANEALPSLGSSEGWRSITSSASLIEPLKA